MLSATTFDAIYSPTDIFASPKRHFFRKHYIKDVRNHVILQHERSGDVVSGIMLTFLSPFPSVFSRAVVKPFDYGQRLSRCEKNLRHLVLKLPTEWQHSARYLPSSGCVGTTYAAPPCDSNCLIRCNSISNRRAVRVSVRRKAKERCWVEPLSPLPSQPSWLPPLRARSRGPIGLWSAPLCGPLHCNCPGHQFEEPRSFKGLALDLFVSCVCHVSDYL